MEHTQIRITYSAVGLSATLFGDPEYTANKNNPTIIAQQISPRWAKRKTLQKRNARKGTSTPANILNRVVVSGRHVRGHGASNLSPPTGVLTRSSFVRSGEVTIVRCQILTNASAFGGGGGGGDRRLLSCIPLYDDQFTESPVNMSSDAATPMTPASVCLLRRRFRIRPPKWR